MHMVVSQEAPGTIVLSDVVRRYRIGDELTISALDHVSLRVEAGSAVALSGPSGSGKSTLIRCINQLERPDAGRIAIDGVEQKRRARESRQDS